jgi:hypothetical protein
MRLNNMTEQKNYYDEKKESKSLSAVESLANEEPDLAAVKKIEKIEKTYDIEGLLIGGGVALLVSLLVSFDPIFGSEIGMFLGLLAGTRFKKDRSDEEENIDDKIDSDENKTNSESEVAKTTIGTGKKSNDNIAIDDLED